ncbi:MAG: ComEC/Rec2 family competence protein [Candidatus Andersenbacteria bacterium]
MASKSVPTFALLGFCAGIWAATGVNRWPAIAALLLILIGFVAPSRATRYAALGILLGGLRVLLPFAGIAGANGVGVQPMVTAVQKTAVARINAAVPYPAAGLTAGVLFGYRDEIPQTFVDDMRASGLSHLLAVSGFNVTIVALVVGRLTQGLVGKRTRTSVIIALVVAYVVLCGAGPPVVRAGLMGGIAALVNTSGRGGDARRALLVAATALIFWNPYVLRFDVGFQLSVAATFGLLSLGPLLQRLVHKLPNPIGMRDAATTSIAASLATLPIVVSVFGVVPVYGIFANILAAPLIPLIMATGSAGLVGGSTLVGHLAGIPTAYLIQVLASIAHGGAHLPRASLQIRPLVAWTITLGAVASISVAQLALKRIHKRRAQRPLLL